jgi:hypothetical protein
MASTKALTSGNNITNIVNMYVADTPKIGMMKHIGFIFHLVATTPLEIEKNIAEVVIIITILKRDTYKYVM